MIQARKVQNPVQHQDSNLVLRLMTEFRCLSQSAVKRNGDLASVTFSRRERQHIRGMFLSAKLPIQPANSRSPVIRHVTAAPRSTRFTRSLKNSRNSFRRTRREEWRNTTGEDDIGMSGDMGTAQAAGDSVAGASTAGSGASAGFPPSFSDNCRFAPIRSLWRSYARTIFCTRLCRTTSRSSN